MPEIIKAGRYFIPDDPYFFEVFQRGEFEINNLFTAMSLCKRFKVAIDGGAHVGSWSIHMAERFTDVYSFEPDDTNYECLWRNTQHLDNVHPKQKALGDSLGRGSIKREEGTNSGAGYVVNGNAFQIVPLDIYHLNVDFLKLDVEGFEYQALQGATETIEKNNPVILIEQKQKTARYGIDYLSAGKFLESIGYKLNQKICNDYIYTRGG